jgi:hypothetical protein
MNRSEILAAIDAEIDRLRKAQALLTGDLQVKGAGKPKTVAAKKSANKPRPPGLSVIGRRRIAKAMKRRWASVKTSPVRKAAKKSGGTEDGGFGFQKDQ